MKALLVSATTFEVSPTLVSAGCDENLCRGLGTAGEERTLGAFDFLVTGVGQLQCAAWLSKVLSQRRYDVVVQAGIAGSFSDEYPHGSVVLVNEEIVSDLGAESPDGFLDVFEMGLVPRDQRPFSAGVLRVSIPPIFESLSLSRVRSVTVNRVLSDARSIAWIEGRYEPQVVNMEGAAFFYTCLMHSVPCVQIRAVSDRVGPRDTSAWDIPGAIDALNVRLREVLQIVANRAGSGGEM